MTPDGRIRHSVFHGLRDDKPAAVTQGNAAAGQAVAAEGGKATRATKEIPQLPADIRISNPQRIIDTSTGLTKLDLVNYYLLAASACCRTLAKRPVALVRAPSASPTSCSSETRRDAEDPRAQQLDPALDPGHPPLIEVDSFTALIGAAQMNVVEFHTWNATTKNIGQTRPHDFRPRPGRRGRVAGHAGGRRAHHALLDELGLVSFLRPAAARVCTWWCR
jgi:bifunctional non-homologous end joining protein LigD